jgi:hypothetical protein
VEVEVLLVDFVDHQLIEGWNVSIHTVIYYNRNRGVGVTRRLGCGDLSEAEMIMIIK